MDPFSNICLLEDTTCNVKKHYCIFSGFPWSVHQILGQNPNYAMAASLKSRSIYQSSYHSATQCSTNTETLPVLPEFGHNSHAGFVTPARHASQNHGSVEHDDMVLDTLAVSDTP
jgi:hypothetical protein